MYVGEVEYHGLVKTYKVSEILDSSRVAFLPSFLPSHALNKKDCLNKSIKMALTIPDIGRSNWKVLHTYQRPKGTPMKSTVLLLRSTVSTGDHFAVGKIITPPCVEGTDDIFVNEASTLEIIPPHPGIIKLYSTHIDMPRPGQVSLILEFCRGGDLASFSDYARSSQRRIPEAFVWHVVYQTLVALEYLYQFDILHGDLHSGNLFLRPVEGDLYPDIVLADFEHAEYHPDGLNERDDVQELGDSIHNDFLKDSDEIEDGTTPFSQELRSFMEMLSSDRASWPTPLLVEMAHDMIPQAKKMCYGDNKTIPRMPDWMIAYFDKLKINPGMRTAASREYMCKGVESAPTLETTRRSNDSVGDRHLVNPHRQ